MREEGGQSFDRMITYRTLSSMAEYKQAIHIQKEVWGFEDVDVIPSRIFLISAEVGGQVLGAFDGDKLVGYCFSIPGIKNGTGERYLHSHMLGVLSDYRNQGIGTQLKLEQRTDALSRGVGLVEWTFDPLEIKNAYLNIEKLGAIIRRYVLNAYGVATSKLHSGMPTDRCVAEWHLGQPRTEAILQGQPRLDGPIEERVSIPSSIYSIRAEDVPQAVAIQKDVTAKFQQYFDAGLAVTGFEKTAEYGSYLLGKWQ
jgi:predicted GNAT superfamily acetyltransferase